MSDSSAALSHGTVERLAVEAIPDKPRRPAAPRLVEQTPPVIHSPPPAATAPAAPAPSRAPNVHELILASFRATALVLAVRLQLLLALIGAFVLALGAMQWQSLYGLGVLIAWCVLAIMPLVWLEYSGRPTR